MVKVLFIGVVASLLVACAQAPLKQEAPVSAVSTDNLRAHIGFLAADSLHGRDTGSRGYQVAADYVASEFTKLGLTPGADKQSYFQQVPLVESRLVEGSAIARVITTSSATELKYPDQFTMGPDLHRESIAVVGKLVFVGYGIVAPEFDHDDYAGLEVEGKIVVMLTGRPQSWPTEEGAHLGSGREKARHAAERGATGRIVLHTPRAEKTFPYEDNFQYLDVPRMNWLDAHGLPDGYQSQLQGGAYFSLEAAALVFEGAPTSLDDVYAADMAGAAVPGFVLASSAALSRRSELREMSSPNVVAVLEGTDPELKNEYLLYSAHLDHLGVINNPEGEEEIYNGVMDNAAGIATLLETARVLKEQQGELKRSVMFIAVTGEEKGLLGAGYFAKNPTVPVSSIVANINLDMPLFLYPFADVVAFGAEHSNLKDYVSRAAEQAGVTLSPDPIPEQGIFVRSDHYRFVQQGVPSVFLVTGFTSKNPDQESGEVFQSFMKEHYHQPSDNLDLVIDYDAGALFTEININIGREVCNSPERPRRNEGDFFGDTFAPSITDSAATDESSPLTGQSEIAL
jgi:hypothetical protein